MKKVLVFLITFFTFNLLNVNALDISIDSVKVKDKSDNTIVGETRIEGLTLTPDITFNNVGDEVTFEVTLKSNDKKAYQIKNITDDNKGNIKTTYTYDKDLSKPILLTIKYDSNGEKIDKVNFSIEVEEVNNPKTGIAIIFFIISITLVWTYVIIDSRKNKRFSKALILGIILLPISSVFAAEKVTLILSEDNIKISEELRNTVFFRKMFVDTSAMSDEGSVASEDVKLVGLTTGLNGEIGLNYYLELSDRVLQDNDCYMQFSFGGTNYTDEIVYLRDVKTKEINGKTSYVFPAGVAAKNIIDPIETQFVLGDGTVIATFNYSVKDYCEAVLNNSSNYSDKFISYVTAMLNYGGYAQLQQNYKTDDLANANIDKTLPEVSLGDEYAKVTEGECTGVTYKGSSVLLTSLADIRVYFTLENDVDDYIIESNGKVLEVQEGSSGLYVAVKNIAPQNMRDMYTVVFSNKQDGTIYKFSYGVYTYIYNLLNNSENYNVSTVDTVKALYQFGEVANEFFSS